MSTGDVEFLIEAVANENVRNKKGKTILNEAKRALNKEK